jgi:hypothetical protein
LPRTRNEALAAYYHRTTNILRHTHGKDRSSPLSSTSTLSGLEEFTLGCVTNASVKGLCDPHLRRKAMNHGALHVVLSVALTKLSWKLRSLSEKSRPLRNKSWVQTLTSTTRVLETGSTAKWSAREGTWVQRTATHPPGFIHNTGVFASFGIDGETDQL